MPGKSSLGLILLSIIALATSGIALADGRPASEIPDEPEKELWEAPQPTDEQSFNNPRVIPPASRARVILRYADTKDLLISGLVENGNEIAQHPAVLDVPSGSQATSSSFPLTRSTAAKPKTPTPWCSTCS